MPWIFRANRNPSLRSTTSALRGQIIYRHHERRDLGAPVPTIDKHECRCMAKAIDAVDYKRCTSTLVVCSRVCMNHGGASVRMRVHSMYASASECMQSGRRTFAAPCSPCKRTRLRSESNTPLSVEQSHHSTQGALFMESASAYSRADMLTKM